ncbi:MAG: NAD(P)H-hydrate epimerase, partial [Treponema sp.]|nr:NAD(P)H-hydrate epimerase [Treponema sp.]
MKLVTGKQMREIEQIAINELGIPSILLMENASIRLADHCLRFIQSIKKSVLIAAGPGNNGGDGLALARLLHAKGAEVKIIFAGDMNRVKGDAAVNLSIVKNLGIPIEQFVKEKTTLLDNIPEIKTIIETSVLTVDALLGTGLDRNTEGKTRELIEAINRYANYVISADIPSGVHSDTGKIMGCAVRADETVTFGFPKIGLYAFPGAEYAGKIHIEDIAIPARLIDRIDAKAEILTGDEAQKMLPARDNCQHPGSRVMRHQGKQRTNKGSFGRIAVFAGSNEMPGAAALTCGAAYKAGGGL